MEGTSARLGFLVAGISVVLPLRRATPAVIAFSVFVEHCIC
jgi:hypothetical protein